MRGRAGKTENLGRRAAPRARTGSAERLGERMAKTFLTAEWRDVVLVNYRVPAELLLPRVPPGAELDTPDGAPERHLLSLVAFDFAAMRVRGLSIPTARRFPEVNLRFYARRGERRATVFLREFVPAPLVVLGARLLYRQPYALARISHEVAVDAATNRRHVRTTFARGIHRGAISLTAANDPQVPPSSSEEHFLKEHYWGFDRAADGRGFRYRVDHPVWRVFPVETATVTIDPGALLGGAWRGLDWPAALHSVLYAEGSAAAVFSPEPLVDPGNGVS